MLSLFDYKMEEKLCIVKTEASHPFRLKMCRKSYNTETKGEAAYPGQEAEIVIEPGKFIIVDAAELDELWLRMQGLCQGVSIDISYQVYIGDSADHSGTLEIADFLNNGGIELFTAAKNELQKRVVTRAQLIRELERRRSSAATTCCVTRFLPCMRTKKQRIKEMEEGINSILGDASTSTANHNGALCDTSAGEGNPPITASTCDVAGEEKA